ncbi:MAG: ABC transporter ATP-binding protein [Candidatus Verstraetearchaeota archaeon]|nr:ABC transporter ATP-binding protein [Candidatus Verstraetearchaeota archaeon]
MRLIRIEGLNAGYGKFQVLFDISTNIDSKKMTVIVGPNGSGKSTILKSIFGLTNIYSGGIFLNGEQITRMSPHQIARRGIAYVPQVGNIFSNLTVRENLMMSGYTLKREEVRAKIPEVLEYYPVLKECYNRRPSTMSGGERQMLAMSMALMRKPHVMLFDEPSASLSPKISAQVLDEIKKLRDDMGITVVLVEQNAIDSLKCGDRAVLLVSGRVAFDGPAQELLGSPELGSMYLGIKAA